jgi:hypothetical protein
MIRFARNLLVVLFAAVGMFAVAGPADARVAPIGNQAHHAAWVHPQFTPATWPTPANWQRGGALRYRGPWQLG